MQITAMATPTTTTTVTTAAATIVTTSCATTSSSNAQHLQQQLMRQLQHRHQQQQQQHKRTLMHTHAQILLQHQHARQHLQHQHSHPPLQQPATSHPILQHHVSLGGQVYQLPLQQATPTSAATSSTPAQTQTTQMRQHSTPQHYRHNTQHHGAIMRRRTLSHMSRSAASATRAGGLQGTANQGLARTTVVVERSRCRSPMMLCHSHSDGEFPMYKGELFANSSKNQQMFRYKLLYA